MSDPEFAKFDVERMWDVGRQTRTAQAQDGRYVRIIANHARLQVIVTRRDCVPHRRQARFFEKSASEKTDIGPWVKQAKRNLCMDQPVPDKRRRP